MNNLDIIFSIVSQQMPKANIDCLLIGGFAVNYYGYTRNTLDVDFMIVAEQINKVRQIMLDAGFTNIDIRESVAFFSLPEGEPRADFLRVDESTMAKLLQNAVSIKIHGRKLRVPALKDLIAMKIFSLKESTSRRMGKDLPDIAYLSVINRLSIESDIKTLCDRYGDPEIYEIIKAQIEGLRSP